jgi:uncharacterized protein YjbI with pentapeptide repeats
MIFDTDVHAWAPVILALQHPGYFYPIGLCLFVVAAILWWWLPEYKSQQKFPTDDDKARTARTALRSDLTLFYSGSVIVLGIVGAIVQFQANIERDQRQQRLTLASDNGKLFANAVEQLQKASDLAQLGAIYNLSELMKQEGFYWPSVIQLNEFLRQAVQAANGNVNRAEIHNSLYVLSERDNRGDGESMMLRDAEPFPLNFSSLNLKGLAFSGLKMWSANFRNTNLSFTFLPGAKLGSGDFECANFEKTNLTPSSLYKGTGATELGAKLRNANFRKARLANVQFQKDHGIVDVENACFEDADITGADISGFNLSRAAGLKQEQVVLSGSHPPVPSDFKVLPCKSFESLCPSTPK